MSVTLSKVAKNICCITINRPDKRNAINLDLLRQLKSTLEQFERNPDYQVAVLTGTLGSFCAGYDLNEIVDRQTGMPKIAQIDQLLWPLGTKLSATKFVIAAIEGHAAGFGFELALRCHFRVADRDARMGFMNRRFGIPIMNGGTVILPRLIGYSRASELIATGAAQMAPDALQSGLIHYIADIGCSLGRAINLARCIAKFEQSAIHHDLRSVEASFSSPRTLELLKLERTKSLKYLQACAPLTAAVGFMEGELCRHGSFDMGNLGPPEAEVTL